MRVTVQGQAQPLQMQVLRQMPRHWGARPAAQAQDADPFLEPLKYLWPSILHIGTYLSHYHPALRTVSRHRKMRQQRKKTLQYPW